jgi:hypothetical protein
MTLHCLPCLSSKESKNCIPLAEMPKIETCKQEIQEALLSGRYLAVRCDVVCTDTVLETINEMVDDPLRTLIQWQASYSDQELGCSLRYLIMAATEEVSSSWAKALFESRIDEHLNKIQQSVYKSITS